MARSRPSFWAKVKRRDWTNWHWQYAHRLRTAAELAKVIDLGPDEKAACARGALVFPWAITPYYASLMDPADLADPIRRQAVPTVAELQIAPDEREDPLAEEAHMPVAGLTHRYPDRVLLYATNHCAVYCRHCNRKRKVGSKSSAPSRPAIEKAVAYIKEHLEVRDVLVSGGDPLSLSDLLLGKLLARIRRIAHVEIIRLATRNPVTLPQRITPGLAKMLRRFAPLYVNTQFNHLKECTPEAAQALDLLADAGCVLGNQMVLLKGINDNPLMVRSMYQWLLAHRCRPYYIFQCDTALGTGHFRTPVASGIEILQALRGWTSGLAVPHYVIDLPGGGGKVPLSPDYLIEKNGRQLTFKNYAGEIFDYREG